MHVEKCVDPVLGQWCSFGVFAHIEKDVFWRNYIWYKAQTFRKCYICDYLQLVKVELNVCFGVGLYGQWKKLTTHPPNCVQNHHFQKRENINFIFLKSECLHLPLTNITGHFRNPKRLFKLSKFSKNRFYPRPPPPHPYRSRRFWADSVSFFNRFLKKWCQTDQVHILHQIRLSPKVFETSPFFSPSIAHHYYYYYWLIYLFIFYYWLICLLIDRLIDWLVYIYLFIHYFIYSFFLFIY